MTLDVMKPFTIPIIALNQVNLLVNSQSPFMNQGRIHHKLAANHDRNFMTKNSILEVETFVEYILRLPPSLMILDTWVLANVYAMRTTVPTRYSFSLMTSIPMET